MNDGPVLRDFVKAYNKLRPCDHCRALFIPKRLAQRFCCALHKDAFHAAQYRAWREERKGKP